MAAGPLDLARSRGARVEHAGRAGAVGVAGAVAAEQTGDGGLHGGRAPAGRAAGADPVGDRVDRVSQLGPGVLDLALDRVRVALLRIVLLRHVASMLACCSPGRPTSGSSHPAGSRSRFLNTPLGRSIRRLASGYATVRE